MNTLNATHILTTPDGTDIPLYCVCSMGPSRLDPVFDWYHAIDAEQETDVWFCLSDCRLRIIGAD